MTNRNYGKLCEGEKIIYAPSELKIGNTYYPAPTAEQYAAFGYLPVRDMPPEAREGYYAVPTGWTKKDGAIVRVYEERAVEPPTPLPTRYSKLRLIAAAKSAANGTRLSRSSRRQDIGTSGLYANTSRTITRASRILRRERLMRLE